MNWGFDLEQFFIVFYFKIKLSGRYPLELNGRVAFGRMDAVTFGRPANEALLKEIDITLIDELFKVEMIKGIKVGPSLTFR